jgi:glutamate synthase (NADPH/NADH) large chain
MIGQSDFLDKESAIEHWKANGLDFSRCSTSPRSPRTAEPTGPSGRTTRFDDVLDRA